MSELTSGLAMVMEERRRQVEVEGWTYRHDMGHGSPTLSRAARCYEVPQPSAAAPDAWPWAAEWWKPKGIVRNLVRAGALYRAALDVAPPLGQDRHVARAGLDRCVAALDDILATRLADRDAAGLEARLRAEGAYHAMWAFFLSLPSPTPLSDIVQREAMRLRAALSGPADAHPADGTGA